jgi:O-antigen/teichoic acid export membrane protein
MRQMAVTVVEQGSYSVANFTISLLLARWLTPREYGSYVLAFAALLFIGGFHNALVLEPLSVFGAVRYRASFRGYLSVLARYQTGLSLALGGLLVVVAGLVPSLLPSDLIENTRGLAIAMPAVFLAWLVRRAFYIAATPRGALVSTLVQSACSLVGLAGMVRFARLSGFSAMVVIAIGALCGAAVGWVRLPLARMRESASTPDTREVLAEHWRFGGWLALTNIAYWVAGQGFIIVIAARLDVAEVGAYNAMQNFVTPVAVIVNALAVLILPWMVGRFAERGPQSLNDAIARVSALLGALTLLGLMPLLAFGAFLTEAAYGGHYLGYHWILGYLVVARLIACVSLAVGMALRAVEASRAVFFAYLATAAFTIVFAAPAAALWGLRGIVLGVVLGEVILASTLWIQWRRHAGAASTSRHEGPLAETVID